MVDLSTKNPDRLFFILAASWFLVLTFIGFSPSFYLRSIPEPLPTHQIIHGVLNSCWVVVFFVQALLITSGRVRWHMVLGKASVLLLALMIPVGFYVVLVKTAAGLKTPDEAGFNLTGLTLILVFAVAGLLNRKRPYYHKRLMLFAALMLTIAAADRAAIVFGLDDVRLFRKVLAIAPGLALIFYDAIRLRRFPLFDSSVVVFVWLIIWFNITDLLFVSPAGEWIIQSLVKIVV